MLSRPVSRSTVRRRTLRSWLDRVEPDSPIRAVADSRFIAWLNLIHAHASIAEQLDRRMEGRGIGKLLTNQVLGRLADDSRELRVIDLSRALLVEKSRISRLIDRMEGQGWVERERSPHDKRNYYLRLTPEGLETYKRNIPIFAEEVYRIFSSQLTDEEVETLTGLLEKVLWGERQD
jgi:DNA-binding MarR family transcriptional regulator